MWRAMLDVMIHYEGAESVSMADLPTMACPDCSVARANESYLSIPFALDLTTTLSNISKPMTIHQRTNAGDYITDAFPTLESDRTRFLGRNVILMGPLLYQYRFDKKGECDAKGKYLINLFKSNGYSCAGPAFDPDSAVDVNSPNREAFGEDAAYSSDATQFLTSVPSGIYRTSNTGEIPTGFSFDQGSGRGDQVQYPYPILFDINFCL